MNSHLEARASLLALSAGVLPLALLVACARGDGEDPASDASRADPPGAQESELGARDPKRPGPDASADVKPDAGRWHGTPVIAAHAEHTCALLGTRVACWGNNYDGSLGVGDSNHRGDGPGEMGAALPFVDLGAQETVRSVASAGIHTCAILGNGRVKCWGANPQGQLGLGDVSSRGTAPGQMGDALPYVDLGQNRTARFVATGAFQTCAILDDGGVKCWGKNEWGMLGLGDTNDRGDQPGEMGDALPYVDLGTGRTAKMLAAGGSHTCAILDDDRVKCWGVNAEGQLGIGDTNHRGDQPGEMGDALPYVDLGAGRTVKHISAGDRHTCAILDDDRVKCWGNNSPGGQPGHLGVGDSNHRGDQPGEMGDALPYVNLGTGRTVKRLTAGGFHACAILDDDRLKCWGKPSFGELGLGDSMPRGDVPSSMGDALPYVALGTGRTAKDVSTGWFHTCAVLDDDSVKCWGGNFDGRLGLGDTIARGAGASDMGDALPRVDLPK